MLTHPLRYIYRYKYECKCLSTHNEIRTATRCSLRTDGGAFHALLALHRHHQHHLRRRAAILRDKCYCCCRRRCCLQSNKSCPKQRFRGYCDRHRKGRPARSDSLARMDENPNGDYRKQISCQGWLETKFTRSQFRRSRALSHSSTVSSNGHSEACSPADSDGFSGEAWPDGGGGYGR